jgi:hypothetical protein
VKKAERCMTCWMIVSLAPTDPSQWIHQKMGTESSLQNIMLCTRDRMMDDVQKCDNYINIPLSKNIDVIHNIFVYFIYNAGSLIYKLFINNPYRRLPGHYILLLHKD